MRALLDEYERLAGGKLTLHVIDPEPFSEEEDRAVGYGLSGVPLGLDEGIFYFGLAGTNSVDDEEVIPFFAAEREQFLEYDVTKLVHNLSNPKQKVVGLLSSLPIEGQGPPMQARDGRHGRAALDGRRSDPPALRAALAASGHLKQIPEDVDVLMLVHPHEPVAPSALRHRSVRAARRAGGRVPRPVLGSTAGRHGDGQAS